MNFEDLVKTYNSKDEKELAFLCALHKVKDHNFNKANKDLATLCYKIAGFNEFSSMHPHKDVRLISGKNIGYTFENLKDRCAKVRYKAHVQFGFDYDGFNYSELDSDLKSLYFYTNGYNENGFTDEDEKIRSLCFFYCGYNDLAKKDESNIIRKNAYISLGYDECAKEDKSSSIRFSAYNQLGWDERALDDTSAKIRMGAYNALGWTEKAFDDKSYEIREAAYKNLYYPESAKKETDEPVRVKAWKESGWTKEALKDPSALVRIACYNDLGWENCKEEAIKDVDLNIRKIAHRVTGYFSKSNKKSYVDKIAIDSYVHFGLDEDAKKSRSKDVRLLYYNENPDDSDARLDGCPKIRRLYHYKNGWDDFEFDLSSFEGGDDALKEEARFRTGKLSVRDTFLNKHYENALLEYEKNIILKDTKKTTKDLVDKPSFKI